MDFSKKDHKEGEIAPHIPLLGGLFQLRVPFIHFPWQFPETLQAFFLFVVAMAAVPVIQDAFPWVSFELAWTMVFWFTLVFWLTAALGDPSIPGWITAAIPVVLLYVKSFPEGVDRIWALMALSIVLSVLCLITGPTGLADYLNKNLPIGLRSGIVLGAGISAVLGELAPGGRFHVAPISITLTGILSFYVLWSISFGSLKKRYAFFKEVGRYGYVPALFIGAILALLFKETSIPAIEWGIFVPRTAQMFAELSIFGVGVPPLSMFLQSVPTALVVYIILYGDWIIIDSLRQDAMNYRPDDPIGFSIARSSVIVAIRNLWNGLVAPYAPLSGPLWAGVTVAVYERHKLGRGAMPTLWAGLLSYQLWWPILVFIAPLVTLTRPFLAISLSSTLLIQGFACSYIAISTLKNRIDMGIAGIVACFLFRLGAAYALAAGLILYFALQYQRESSVETSQSSKG